jgi:hypothetical protein
VASRQRKYCDAFENGEIDHVCVFADEQRKKVQCRSTNLAGLFCAGAISGQALGHRFRAGRFHTQFLGIEHGWLAEIGYRRPISSSGYGTRPRYFRSGPRLRRQHRVPRRRECTGMLNVNLDFQPLAAVDDLEALPRVPPRPEDGCAGRCASSCRIAALHPLTITVEAGALSVRSPGHQSPTVVGNDVQARPADGEAGFDEKEVPNNLLPNEPSLSTHGTGGNCGS